VSAPISDTGWTEVPWLNLTKRSRKEEDANGFKISLEIDEVVDALPYPELDLMLNFQGISTQLIDSRYEGGLTQYQINKMDSNGYSVSKCCIFDMNHTS
jgi:hypothetical protein